MSAAPDSCALCAKTDDLRAIVVAAEPLHLCAGHAIGLGEVSAAAYADLAMFFAELGGDRRQVSDRRVDDRRFFPRPETRRSNQGRRLSDPEA
jgi:hypothetical protein